MRRRIIKQGHNTLTVSLPRRWCDNLKLKGGEEIDINEKGSCLVLSKEAFKGSRNVTVDVTGLDRSTIILLIQSLYTYGYEAITITTKDSEAMYHFAGKHVSIPEIVNYAVNRLIGAELVSSSSSRYKIEVLTEESKEKFDTILRRIFRLIIELFDAFIERYRKLDTALIVPVELKHYNIRRFVNYALRMLNKFGHEEADKTTFYYSILMFLAKTDEAIKNLSGPKDMPLKVSKKCCDMIEEIKDAFVFFYELFYNYDVKKVSQLHKQRDLFKNKLHDQYRHLSKDDIYLLGSLLEVFDYMIELCELRMAIAY